MSDTLSAHWIAQPYDVRLLRLGLNNYTLRTWRGSELVHDSRHHDTSAAFRAFEAQKRKRETEIALARAPKHSAPLFAPIQSEMEL